MDNKELLKAIGETDDRFIEEAAPEVKDGAAIKFPSKDKVAKDGTAKRTSWKKWLGAAAAVVAVCIIGSVAFSGLFMGKSSMAYDSVAEESYYDYGVSKSEGFSTSGSSKKIAAENSYDASNGTELYTKDENGNLISSSIANLGKDNLKLVYTASMSLQTTDFDKSESALSALVNQYNGYFESVQVNNNGMYANDSYRYADYTVRIPAENYEAFINAVGESSHVVSLKQSVEDIGESYYEIEGRLETLYTKQERLQELLKQAGTMSDIIELESALSDTEYQIDSLKGTLNHYDSLVGYSTVYIVLETVVRTNSGITQDMSFGARIIRAFKNGLTYTANNIEDFILWIAANIIEIIIFAVIVFLLIRFRPIKKLANRIKKHK